MTISPEAPTQTRDLQVRTDPAGHPLAIRHDGQIWLVDPATESRHWFGSDGRQDARRAATVGCEDLGGIEHWRVQVRLSSSSAPRTFELRRDPLTEQWLLEDVRDGH